MDQLSFRQKALIEGIRAGEPHAVTEERLNALDKREAADRLKQAIIIPAVLFINKLNSLKHEYVTRNEHSLISEGLVSGEERYSALENLTIGELMSSAEAQTVATNERMRGILNSTSLPHALVELQRELRALGCGIGPEFAGWNLNELHIKLLSLLGEMGMTPMDAMRAQIQSLCEELGVDFDETMSRIQN